MFDISDEVSFKYDNKRDPLSENPHSSYKHAYWKKRNFKIIYEIMRATGKYLQGLMGTAIS